ncbi:hypothetical protein [Aliiglaciecola litoralis]|uniref:Uncharacterized protein n=1 Tax=Aliiglaciecola litoralis TaxID=582857 RepID=A0ABP3WTX8_9ALTE
MTKLHDDSTQSHFETDVSELYQQRKSRHRATASMKRQTLQQAKTSSNWTSLVGKFQLVAIAASTMLLFSLVALQSYEIEHLQPKLEYTSVFIHSFDDTTDQDYSQIKTMYQQHTEDFVQRKALLASHHQKSAVLSQFAHGWELKTCDQELVKISKELVDTLTGMDLINSSLKTGDNVQIAFNAKGLIVGIEPAKNVQQCT